MFSARRATSSMTCSQLSSTRSSWRPRRKLTMLAEGSSWCTTRPNAAATVLATSAPSLSGPNSRKWTLPSKLSHISCASAVATVVFPMPPGPRRVTKRSRSKRAANSATASSRPTIRPNRRGRDGGGAPPPAHRAPPGRRGGWRRGPFGHPRRGCSPLRAPATPHGRDKAIAPARDVGDVAGTILSVAQHLAQLRDKDAQADLLDGKSGPRIAENFVLRDHFAGATDQQAQNIRRAAAEPDRQAILLQQPRPKRKWPERDGIEI